MGTHDRIYLDNNATTPVDPRVASVLIEELTGPPANPSSIHSYGQQARNQLVRARRSVATHFGVAPKEVIFTSGGTEALNLLLRGLFPTPSGHLITSTTEHSAVKQTVEQLEKQGLSVSWLTPSSEGALSAAQVEAAIRQDSRCIALMAANNETGVKHPIEAIAKIAEMRRIPLIVDGVALLGKEPISIPQGVSAIAFSGHKIHAPKGIGLAIVRQGLPLVEQITGGAQEVGRRAGTENLGGILALAKAIELLASEQPAAMTRMERLRDQLEGEVLRAIPQTVVNGGGPRIVNTSNISFLGIDVEALMMSLDMEGVAISHASACASGSLEPSHVILGMGLGQKRALSSLRFSLSRMTTEAEIERATKLIIAHARRLHEMMSL